MNIELEKWLLDALKVSSSGRVAIEAFGTPGAGKSYLSHDLFTQVIENDEYLAYHSIDQYHKNNLLRTISKLSLILKSCWYRWSFFSIAFRIIFSFGGLKFLRRIKLSFNLLLIISVIQLRSKKGSPIILDQGIFQALWSCYYYQQFSIGPKEKDVLRLLIIQLIECLDIKLLLIVYVSASKEVIVNGLKTRLIKGRSELNSLKDDLIERGMCATSNMIDIINDIADSNPKIKLIEIPRQHLVFE